MLRKRFLYSLLFMLTVSFNGCEYELSTINMLDKDKPAESHRLDLSLISIYDTIHINGNQIIDYAVNTYGLKLVKVEFKLGSYFQCDKTTNTGSFTLNPAFISNGIYELTMHVYTNSGTGSLADKLGGEGYWAERKWVVKINKPTKPDDGGIIIPVDTTIDNSPTVRIKNIKYEVTPDGYLKFSWPKVKRKDFYKYQVYWSDGFQLLDIQRYKANDTTYIDSTFIGGTNNFRVDYSRLHDNMAIYGESLSFNESYPTVSVTGIGIDSVNVHWPKSKYRARYEVKDYYGKVLFKSDTDTSFTVAAPFFGSSSQFNLYVTPRYRQTLDFMYFKSSMKYYSLGTPILSNWPVFACNQTEKMAYAVNYDAINCYSLPDMTLYKKLPIINLGNQGLFACPTNSSKVAALSSDYIFVFDNKSLTNPIKIPYPCWAKNINYLCLTDNDLVGVASSTSYDLYRVSDQTFITSIPIADSPIYSPWCSSAASSDGKYFIVVTLNGLHQYKIENTVFTEVYSDKRPYFSVLFDPYHPERFYVTLQKSNVIEMRSSIDFSLIKSYVLPGNYNMLQNIDPETGYLLLTNYYSNYLYDLKNEKIVFTMANSNTSDFNPRFYYGNLFSSNGHYLNISKYIQP